MFAAQSSTSWAGCGFHASDGRIRLRANAAAGLGWPLASWAMCGWCCCTAPAAAAAWPLLLGCLVGPPFAFERAPHTDLRRDDSLQPPCWLARSLAHTSLSPTSPIARFTRRCWHRRPFPQLAINPGWQAACTEVVCAPRGVVSTTLARDSKVTRCLLCNYYRGFRISKTTAEVQIDSHQDQNSPPKHRYPDTGHSHRYLYNPKAYPQPLSDVFAVRTAGAWRTVRSKH